MVLRGANRCPIRGAAGGRDTIGWDGDNEALPAEPRADPAELDDVAEDPDPRGRSASRGRPEEEPDAARDEELERRDDEGVTMLETLIEADDMHTGLESREELEDG
ncbi:unnamed protein product, partial [Ectocarpus sp. 12 AP-2014]